MLLLRWSMPPFNSMRTQVLSHVPSSASPRQYYGRAIKSIRDWVVGRGSTLRCPLYSLIANSSTMGASVVCLMAPRFKLYLIDQSIGVHWALCWPSLSQWRCYVCVLYWFSIVKYENLNAYAAGNYSPCSAKGHHAWEFHSPPIDLPLKQTVRM